MRRWSLVGFLVAAFVARLVFGLGSEYWMDDERQIYLIGLKYYATGEWPYLGPDVVYTQSQIPGGLQGLLVGGPFWIAPYPEAPFVLLNLLSLGALWLLAWYISRRLPDVPRWFVWPLVFFSPWTLNFSTHVTNPSYVLVGAVPFFVSTFELLPFLSIGAMPRRLAFFLAGFGLLWVAQIHLSFPLLLPFVLLALGFAATNGWRSALQALVWLSAGALLSGSTLIPTLAKYGMAAGGVGANITFDPGSLVRLPEVVARFFSFGSFELPRFLGPNTATRLEFLGNYPWAAPFAVFAGVCGLVQPVILLGCLFWKAPHPRTWPGVRGITIATLGLVYVSFVFSVKDPSSHTFYVTLPVVMIYSVYCWRLFLQRRAGRLVAAALIVSGLVTHTAIAVDGLKRRSLYKDRALVVRAVREKNDRLLGERRPVMWEAEGSRR